MSEPNPRAGSGTAHIYPRWQPPVWDTVASAPVKAGVTATATEPLAASALEQLQRDAYEEAYALGLAEGRAAGQDRLAAEISRWQALIEALAQPLTAVDAAVERALMRLVQVLVRQVLERELRETPAILLGWIKTGLAALPAAAGPLEIRLHPADAERVREALAESARWRLIEDERLALGACRIEGADAQVDAGLDERLTAAFAHVFDASGDQPGSFVERFDGG
ncbi:MAG TPA: FliH/SctL family protein [Candidatus Acidoferrales bacterium]|nr:FliH/SctL family protein [Candidatus Acidoferrales bacterium]